MALVFLTALEQQNLQISDGLCEESAGEGNGADELEEGADEYVEDQMQEDADMRQTPFWEDYFWFKKIYDEAVVLAEEHGLYQFLDIEKTWMSVSGDYCICFGAEYSDIGIYLKAQSADIYELTFRDSIYTEGFAEMNYRMIYVR